MMGEREDDQLYNKGVKTNHVSFLFDENDTEKSRREQPRSGGCHTLPDWAWSGQAELGLNLLARAGYGHTRPYGI